MTNTNFTPGILIDGGDGSVWQYRPEVDADRAIVLPSQYIQGFPEEAKKYGKIFAAAPDMYEALQDIVDASSAVSITANDMDKLQSRILRVGKAALAKTGGQ